MGTPNHRVLAVGLALTAALEVSSCSNYYPDAGHFTTAPATSEQPAATPDNSARTIPFNSTLAGVAFTGTFTENGSGTAELNAKMSANGTDFYLKADKLACDPANTFTGVVVADINPIPDKEKTTYKVIWPASKQSDEMRQNGTFPCQLGTFNTGTLEVLTATLIEYAGLAE